MEAEAQALEKPKRTLTQEQKDKMQAGRKKKAEKVVSPEVVIKNRNITVFGKVDRNRDGKIMSEYPSWYFDKQREELEIAIENTRKQLDDGSLPSTVRARVKNELSIREAKLEKIMADSPKLEGSDRDYINSVKKDLAEELGRAHFTRDERLKGLVDAHEEAHRMVDPVIQIKNERQAEFCKACGVQIRDGKVSRNDMDRMHKIASRMLGESTDIEYLRR